MREATRHKTRKKGAGTSSDITRHHRVRDDRRVPYRPSPGPATRMVVACRMARRRAWRRGWSSRAVVSVAGHGVPYGPVRAGWPVAGSCAVGPVDGLSPDRVPSRPSPDHVSPWSGSYRRPLSPCRDHRLARRRPVICHAPAQQSPVADAANRCVACGFTCQYRGVLSTPVRRRGSGGSLGRPHPQNVVPDRLGSETSSGIVRE